MTARTAALAALALASAAAAGAQPAFDLAVGGSLQSLASPALGTTDAQPSLLGGAGAGLDFASGHGHAGYGLDTGAYASEGDWSYRLHRLDTRFRFDLSPSVRLHAGAEGVLRRNGAVWRDADYDAAAGFLNLEILPRTGTTLRTGYRVDRRVFDRMPALDQTEQAVFLSLIFNLPSRTTLIAEARAGVKGYRGEVVAASAADPASAAAPDPGVATGSPGAGSGKGSAGTAGHSPGVSSAGMGPSTRPLVAPSLASSAERARQVSVLARVAQSLGDRTGLSLQGTWRSTGGSVPPAVVTTPAGFFDDGVYDDPYASDQAGAELKLKHVRPGGAVLEASARRFVQSYGAALALGVDGRPRPGAPLREDRVWRASATVELPLFPSRTGALAVGLQLGYGFTRSASNDVFYDYRSHSGAAALLVSY